MSKARGSSNQLQNNHINYEFNKNLHNLSLMRDTISRGLLMCKLEMHMTFENRLYKLVKNITYPKENDSCD